MSEFKDKLIMVTGASSGIGKAVSLRLANLGAKVILVARRKEKLEEVCSLMNGNGIVYPFDLNDITGIESFIKNITSTHGKLSGIVHCSGIDIIRPLNLLKYDDIHKIMNINFYSFVEIVRCFSKNSNHIVPASIVGISSIASVRGDKGKIAYCASKAAMDASVRCMAKELGKKGIRINSIRPSWVKTDIYYNNMSQISDSNSNNEFINSHIFGILETSDVANLIEFLLSEKSSKITGSSIFIDSGCMA